MRKLRIFIKETDNILLLICLVTSAFGALMVYSATRCTLSEGQIISRDSLTMIISLVIGVIMSVIMSLIDFDYYFKLCPIIAVGCLGLMVVTLIWGVAPPLRPDAKTWIDLGFFYFQPSELLKIGFIITFSAHLNLVKQNLDSFKTVLLLGIHALVPIALVAKSGDAGSALVFIVIFLAMTFVAGVHWIYFAAGFTSIAVTFPVLWALGDKFIFKEYQKARFLAIIYPELYAEKEAYQQNLALNAIGSGKIFGHGLFKGSYTQQGKIPESENDMILSVVGEELGFFGIALLIILLTMIILRIIKVGKKSRNNVSFIACCGMAAMIAGQAIINIGMCMRLLPVIGITLPFFSAGGSSNLCIYIGIGLVLSVYRHSRERAPVDFRVRNIATGFSR